jgi:hypothetical protein
MTRFRTETCTTARRTLADAELALVAGGQFYDPIGFVDDPLLPSLPHIPVESFILPQKTHLILPPPF